MNVRYLWLCLSAFTLFACSKPTVVEAPPPEDFTVNILPRNELVSPLQFELSVVNNHLKTVATTEAYTLQLLGEDQTWEIIESQLEFSPDKIYFEPLQEQIFLIDLSAYTGYEDLQPGNYRVTKIFNIGENLYDEDETVGLDVTFKIDSLDAPSSPDQMQASLHSIANIFI